MRNLDPKSRQLLQAQLRRGARRVEIIKPSTAASSAAPDQRAKVPREKSEDKPTEGRDR